MKRSPLRFGLVGCGRLAEVGYVPACIRATDVHLVAVADPDPGRRSRVAANGSSSHRSLAAFPDAEAMLEQSEIDALVLATPAAAHVRDATLAAEAGVPVLVEKPPAVDAAGAARLASLGPLISIGFNRRFDPGAQAVRAAVPPEGQIELTLELAYRRVGWGAHTVRDGVLLDLAPHLIDWARWLSGGDVTEVTATELEDDRAALALTLTRGRATIVAAADRIHRERVEVRDTSGELLARHRVGGAVAAMVGRLSRGAAPHPLESSLAAQLEAFAATVRGERADVLGTAEDGLAVMTVIDAARRSADRGGRPAPIVADPPEHAPC